jgi:hypothetical protein
MMPTDEPGAQPSDSLGSDPAGKGGVTVGDVRRLTHDLPRSYEALVRDRIKFRVGQIVYLAFSRDETILGFAFPKEERAALVAAQPEVYRMPSPADLRYNWVEAYAARLDPDLLSEIVLDAWSMVVPKSVAAEQFRNRVPHRDL